MAVRIRLRRMGAKKRPYFRFVVAESTAARNGRFIDAIGYYHPVEKPARIVVDEAKVFIWLKNGARPTEAVNTLFRRIGLNRKWALLKKGQDVSGVSLITELPERRKKKARRKVTSETTPAKA